MPISVRHSGAWQEPAVSVRDGGTWKTPEQVYVRDGGLWVPLLDTAVPVTSISFVTYETTWSYPGDPDITIPATAQAGDLGILVDLGWEWNTTVPPIKVIPTGWTEASNTSGSNGSNRAGRCCVSYKVLTSGDPGLVIQGMPTPPNSNLFTKILMVFRGDVPFTTASVGIFGGAPQMTSANPSSITINASVKAGPVVVLGVTGNWNGTPSFASFSPAQTATLGLSVNDLLVGYKIYNSSPVNHTVDMGDNGDLNYLGGFLAYPTT